MFADLNNIFPDHTHFYEVGNMTFSDAMERCARLSADDSHVINYQGKVVFAVKHAVDTAAIDWLNPVAGSPIDVPTQDNE